MITFGLPTRVTNEETNKYIEKLIYSIEIQDVLEYEIIIVGNYTNPNNHKNVRLIDFPEDENDTSYITRKQNLIIDESKYETIVFLRDYNVLWSSWFKGFKHFNSLNDDWNVLLSPILNTDGSRWRDVCHFDKPGERSLQYLPPYSNLDQNHCYINGGYFCTRKAFINKVRWDDSLEWGSGEDVNISLKMRLEFDFKYMFNPYSIVQLQKYKDRILPVYPHEYFGTNEYCLKQYEEWINENSRNS